MFEEMVYITLYPVLVFLCWFDINNPQDFISYLQGNPVSFYEYFAAPVYCRSLDCSKNACGKAFIFKDRTMINYFV